MFDPVFFFKMSKLTNPPLFGPFNGVKSMVPAPIMWQWQSIAFLGNDYNSRGIK
jgi:hypothetical protein